MYYNGEPVKNADGKVIGHIFGFGEVTETPLESEKTAVTAVVTEETEKVSTDTAKPVKTTRKTVRKTK